jgi:hypothetical protein
VNTIIKGYSSAEKKARAIADGWSPIPSERTLRRQLERQVSWQDRYMARRSASANGKV